MVTHTNTVISNNYFSENGWALGCAGGAVTNTNYQFYGNWLHNFDGKYQATGAHVNGIHCYDLESNSPGGQGIQSFYLYNNSIRRQHQGTGGWTARVYHGIERSVGWQLGHTNTGTLYAFQQRFRWTVLDWETWHRLQTGGGVNHFIVNNYFYGDA